MSFSISQMASSRASLVFSLCTNTLHDDILDDVFAASLTPRRCHFQGTTSQWFDDFEPAESAPSDRTPATPPPTPSDSDDADSLRTVESLDDEQLRRSPIDSFAAMCWDATVEAEMSNHAPPPLARCHQALRLPDKIPRIPYYADPKPASTALFMHSGQALPCLAPVSSKAARILDLPCDMAVIPTLLDMPTTTTRSSRPATLAGRWKKAVQSLSQL